MNNLVFLSIFGNNKLLHEQAKYCIMSIRDIGDFNGDIFVFTDPQNWKFLKNILHKSYDCTYYNIDIDYFDNSNNFQDHRIYANTKLDFSQYEKVLYTDVDVLVHSKLKYIFELIVDDTLYITNAPYYPPEHPAFTYKLDENKKKKARKIMGPTGICSGICGGTSHGWNAASKEWRKIKKEFPSLNDQNCLNRLIIDDIIDYKIIPNTMIGYPIQSPIGDNRLEKPTNPILCHYNGGKLKGKATYKPKVLAMKKDYERIIKCL